MPEYTPFDELQAYYGPDGPGCKKPCAPHIEGFVRAVGNPGTPLLSMCKCEGTGTILDFKHPMFEALWELKDVFCEDEGCEAGGIKHGYRISHLHPDYVPRPRAEAALGLLETLDGDVSFLVLPTGAVSCKLGGGMWTRPQLTRFDALCAAFVANLKDGEELCQ